MVDGARRAGTEDPGDPAGSPSTAPDVVLTAAELRAVQNDRDQVARRGEGYERWEKADGRYAGARKTARLPWLLPDPP